MNTKMSKIKDRLLHRDSLLNKCERSKRYHSARLRFYENAHRWTLFLIVISSALAVWTEVYGSRIFAILSLGLFSLLLSLVSLVFDFNGKGRKHESLYQRFSSLNGDVETLSNPDQKNLDIWNRQIHDIYTDEPPVYSALNQHCYNQVLQSLYHKDTEEYKKYFSPLKFYQRWFMNIYHFPTISY